MSTTPAVKDDTAIRELVPTKVRLIVQTRKPQANGKDTSYTQLKGHARIAEVRTLREFRRLWRDIEAVIDGGTWRDVRRAPAASELPVAGAPLADDRT